MGSFDLVLVLFRLAKIFNFSESKFQINILTLNNIN